ncbi:MAG: RHS repeat-associated core domain-containing protein [Anaerohalosphaeraceae bacterium]
MVSYMYDGFGNVRAVSGTADNPYGFTGESQFTEADNLIFLRARYYAPALGRFLSRDPILTPVRLQGYVGWLLPYLNLHKSPQALHPYLYVLNNPVNHVDPTGLVSEEFESCWKDCADPLTGGLMGRICGSGLSLGSLAAAVAKAGTLSKILGIVPTWMASVAVGCAIGCGLFG